MAVSVSVVGILWGVCLRCFYKQLINRKISAKIFGSFKSGSYLCNTEKEKETVVQSSSVL